MVKCRRIQDWTEIPYYLLTELQTDEPDFDPDTFYNQEPADEDNFLFLFEDPDRDAIIGWSWAVINRRQDKLHIAALVLDDNYKGKGILKKVIKMYKLLRDDLKLKRVTFLTNRPKAFKRLGFNTNYRVLMEES